eukprot:scaffold16545_cov121-Isochrysis_galbana.AAC.5
MPSKSSRPSRTSRTSAMDRRCEGGTGNSAGALRSGRAHPASDVRLAHDPLLERARHCASSPPPSLHNAPGCEPPPLSPAGAGRIDHGGSLPQGVCQGDSVGAHGHCRPGVGRQAGRRHWLRRQDAGGLCGEPCGVSHTRLQPRANGRRLSASRRM